MELTELAFSRIDAYNPKINAVILEFREQALARAREADPALTKKQWWGPFHGVPITVKESFGMEGVPTSAGLPQYKDFRPKTECRGRGSDLARGRDHYRRNECSGEPGRLADLQPHLCQ